MDFPASALLCNNFVFLSSDKWHFKKFLQHACYPCYLRLLAFNRWTSQDCFGRVTYREDLVEMSGGIIGLQHRFCPQWSFFLVCISPVTSTQDNHTRSSRVSSSEVFPDLFPLQEVPWMGIAWRLHIRR